MTPSAIIFVFAFAAHWTVGASDSRTPWAERCCSCNGNEDKDLDELMQGSRKPKAFWTKVRIEQTWTATFIGGLTGTAVGSLMAGAGCLGSPETINAALCTAGIGIGSAFAFITMCGATLGIVSAAYGCYVEQQKEMLQSNTVEDLLIQ